MTRFFGMNKFEPSYKILLDNNWSLEEFTIFTRLYFQNYSFIYCLEDLSFSETNSKSSKLERVLKEFQLRSGLSYVNIYTIFRDEIRKDERPDVKSIKYASPGWIELYLNYEVAIEIAKAITIFLTSTTAVVVAYKKLYKIFIDLHHLRKEKKNMSLKLDVEHIKTVNQLNNELAKGLGYTNLDQLIANTNDVEETSKLLMAHYRRMNKMAEFVRKGKANFPEK